MYSHIVSGPEYTHGIRSTPTGCGVKRASCDVRRRATDVCVEETLRFYTESLPLIVGACLASEALATQVLSLVARVSTCSDV